MQYILINPVVQSMYSPDLLDTYLAEWGYHPVPGYPAIAAQVLHQYAEVLEQSSLPIVDMRCPKAAAILQEMVTEDLLCFPDIEPILLQTARAFSADPRYSDGDKTVITPCLALAEAGSKLHLPQTAFSTWTNFLSQRSNQGFSVPPCHLPKESPVPPGFFSSICRQTHLLTGAQMFTVPISIPHGTRLIEMLYCQNGCHMGDGIIYGQQSTANQAK